MHMSEVVNGLFRTLLAELAVSVVALARAAGTIAGSMPAFDQLYSRGQLSSPAASPIRPPGGRGDRQLATGGVRHANRDSHVTHHAETDVARGAVGSVGGARGVSVAETE